MMEGHVFEIVLLVINALLGIIMILIGFVMSDLKTAIKELKEKLSSLIGKEVCTAYRSKIEGDINNLGQMVREHSHE
jgi:hypothetical protein